MLDSPEISTNKTIVQGQSDVSAICPEKQLMKALDLLIEANYIFQRGQDFYSERLNVTYYYLNSLTKKYCGKTVCELVHERLLRECKLLLLETALSAKAITYQLNFSDPSNFSKFFKAYTGLTPLQYRKVASVASPFGSTYRD